MSGAPHPDDLASVLRDAGFSAIVIQNKTHSAQYIKEWLPGSGAEDYVVSANITATKPGGASSGGAAAKADTEVDADMPARMRGRNQRPKANVDC